MSADKQNRPVIKFRTPPKQPDYSDEISTAQLNAIRKLADPDGESAANRVVLYAEEW